MANYSNTTDPRQDTSDLIQIYVRIDLTISRSVLIPAVLKFQGQRFLVVALVGLTDTLTMRC